MAKSKPWYVYMIECASGALYTGITTDVARRFKEHGASGAKYTRANPPRRVVHVEKVRSRSLALKREAAIKRLTRQEKLELAKGDDARRNGSCRCGIPPCS